MSVQEFGPLLVASVPPGGEVVYTDAGTGAKQDLVVSAPGNAPSETPFFLGHTAANTKGALPGAVWVGTVEGAEDLLAAPVDYERVWTDAGTGGHQEGACWRPVPPAGYKALGCVFTPNYDKPTVSRLRCVREDYVQEGVIGEPIWSDRGSGAREDLCLYSVTTPAYKGDDATVLIVTGTFIGVDSYTKPDTHPCANVLRIPVAKPGDEIDLAAGKPVWATTSSQGRGPECAVDGLLHTWWQSAYAAPYPQVLQVDLTAPCTARRLVLKLRDDWSPRTQTLSVEGSMDGSAFTTIVPSATYSFAPHAAIELPAGTSARCLRLVFTANSGPVAADGAGQLSGFEVYGQVAGAVGPRIRTPGRPGSARLSLGTQRSFVGSVWLGFSGELTWDGEGSWSINGTLSASSSSDARRSTVWLEYCGENASWKRSSETATTRGREGKLPAQLSGKLTVGEKLDVRLGSWQEGAFGIGSTEYSDKQQYQISAS